MKKQYRLLLCEDKLINNSLVPTPCYELAATDNNFSGGAYDIEFYTKIDGTHELTFKMPQYYFDENKGEYVYNSIIDHLINKSKIEVVKSNKSFLMVINEIQEEEKDNTISYTYSCIDAYIEELSKNGYGIFFSDEVEDHNGLGTIHEFAEKIIKDTDWEYVRDNTGILNEYKKELQYNIDQARYDYVNILMPVHPVKYISELEEYCQETRLTYTDSKNILHKIYCHDKTEQITSNAVQNLLYNAKDFVDTSGWAVYRKVEENGKIEIKKGDFLLSVEKQSFNDKNNYYLSVNSVNEQMDFKLLNSTSADGGKTIQPGIPYYVRIESPDSLGGWSINSVEIYDGNPLIDKDLLPACKINSLTLDTEYVLRSDVLISHPYFVLNCVAAENSNKRCLFSAFHFFQITGQEVIKEDGTVIRAEDNSNLLIQELHTNGMTIPDKYSGIKGISYANGKIGIIQYPETAIPTSTTLQYVQYFYRKNYQYDENSKVEKGINPLVESTIHYLSMDEVLKIEKIENNSIGTINSLSDKGKIGKVYLLTTDNKYYQYYSIDPNGEGKWDYAFLDEGNNDKRRTLVSEKSNRFNLIQELAELFSVWPVFNIGRDANGIIQKQFWFKEDCIRENFSGFHKDVNLISLGRTIDSTEIVTKMYVENQETDLSPNGFVSIVNSSLNPWGENYYYDFSYYVNQKILNTFDSDGYPIVQKDLNTLYTEVKTLNHQITTWNDEASLINKEYREQGAKEKSLSISIAAMNERISKLTADKKEYENLLNNSEQENMPDYQQILNSLSNYESQKALLNEELTTIQNSLTDIEKNLDIVNEKIATAIQDKKDLIKAFEDKYIYYIKEGVWADSSYSEDDTYYLDSLKVMATSTMPKISWQIKVLDGEVTDELEDYVFQVGDKTILVDDSFFFSNEEGVKNFTFEVLISGIKECLDNPENNEIEVRNYTTSFEELFSRISAATQTLQLNEQTYNKSAYFTVNGEIDASILQKTLKNNALILANSVDNTYSVNDTGITVHKINNSTKQVRVNAEGIFVANSLNENGEIEWKTGITADGISADLITSGEINTSVIKIFSKGEPSFSWNNLGISAYELSPSGKVDSGRFIRFDQFGLYRAVNGETKFNYDAVGEPWFKGMSREEAIVTIQNNSIFSLTDGGFRLNVKEDVGNGSIILGYEKDRSYGLYIRDTNGDIVVKLQNTGINEIAGWEINNYGLSKTVIKDGKSLTTGFQTANFGNISLAIGATDKNEWATASFYVTHDGKLYATGANIDGDSIFTGTIKAISGKIGDWTLTKEGLFYGESFSNAIVGMSPTDYNYAFWAGYDAKTGRNVFRVAQNGHLYATDANIKGHIEAESGTFKGRIEASSGSFSNSVTIGGTALTAGQLKDLYEHAKPNKHGDITHIEAGSGTIGGWTINSGYLQSPNDTIALNGKDSTIIIQDHEFFPKSITIGIQKNVQMNPGYYFNGPGFSFISYDGQGNRYISHLFCFGGNLYYTSYNEKTGEATYETLNEK